MADVSILQRQRPKARGKLRPSKLPQPVKVAATMSTRRAVHAKRR